MADGGGELDVFLGPFSDDCGLTLHDLTNPEAGELRTIKNGLVPEIIDNIPNHNAAKAADLLLKLALQLREYKPDSLRQKFSKLVKTRTLYRKNSKALLPTLLSKDFMSPMTPPLPPASPVKRSCEELEAENEQIKEELKQMKQYQKQLENELNNVVLSSQRLTQKLDQIVSNHRSVISAIAKDIKKLTLEKNKLQRSYASKSSELDIVNSRVHTLRKKSEIIKSLEKKVKQDAESTEKKDENNSRREQQRNEKIND